MELELALLQQPGSAVGVRVYCLRSGACNAEQEVCQRCLGIQTSMPCIS